jgi:hypothetical protein
MPLIKRRDRRGAFGKGRRTAGDNRQHSTDLDASGDKCLINPEARRELIRHDGGETIRLRVETCVSDA